VLNPERHDTHASGWLITGKRDVKKGSGQQPGHFHPYIGAKRILAMLSLVVFSAGQHLFGYDENTNQNCRERNNKGRFKAHDK
jgi:hypothetical protein